MGKLEGYRQVTFYIRPSVHRSLEAAAKRRRQPRYEVVEEALLRLFAVAGKKEKK